MNRRVLAGALVLALSAASTALAGPHPHYDDGGAVNWKANWAQALAAARQTGKPIFIDAGIEN